jgi:hypothetical protein
MELLFDENPEGPDQLVVYGEVAPVILITSAVPSS